MMTTTEICNCNNCPHGCTPETGCQGHEGRARAPELFRRQAQILAAEMAAQGLVLTVEQRPRQPLAMGNYETVVSVRPARGRY